MNPDRWGVRSAGRVVAVMAAALTAAALAFSLTGGTVPAPSAGTNGADTLRVLADGPAPSPASSPQSVGDGGSGASDPSPFGEIRSRDAGLVAGSRSASARADVPTRLVVPALGATLPVEPTGLDDAGFMDLPASPTRAGWYRFGPAPGSGEGAIVLAAHVDTRREGPGPLARLQRLEKADTVEVVTTTGRHRYQVVGVERLDKSRVDLDDLFSRSGPERIHVITCGGEFDPEARRYQDNVIAVAVRIGTT